MSKEVGEGVGCKSEGEGNGRWELKGEVGGLECFFLKGEGSTGLYRGEFVGSFRWL